MTMFIITDGNNNVSRDKPVEHIDMVNGLHVSACTPCTRTMRVRRDIAIDITESVQLLVRFNALRSMPVMPKLEHYNQNAMRSMAAAALARWPHRPLQQMRERGRASPANVKSGCPGPIPKCHACIGPPHRPRPARTCTSTIAHTTARTHGHARPQTWPGAFAQMSACFHPRYACMRVRYGG